MKQITQKMFLQNPKPKGEPRGGVGDLRHMLRAAFFQLLNFLGGSAGAMTIREALQNGGFHGATPKMLGL